MRFINRRGALASLGAATFAAACAPAPAAPPSVAPAAQGAADVDASRRFFARHGLTIGVQLYTFGDAPRNDFAGTLAAVKRIGFETVELPGFYGRPPAELRAAIEAAGLSCTSVHTPLRGRNPGEPSLDGDLGAAAAGVLATGSSWAVAPILVPPEGLALERAAGESVPAWFSRVVAAMTADHWKALADELNRVGAGLKAEGVRFGYHNHNIEFIRAGDRTGMDILLAETDPELVAIEIDVGWVAAAGVDPAALMAAHPGRFKLMHVKDLKASTTPNVSLRMDPTEVGSGAIDWPRVMAAAHAAGVRDFYIEQEPPFAMEQLEAAAVGWRFLSALEA